MAGYSPNQIDQYQAGVAPEDMSFLQYALTTKNQQYETGLNQVKSVYSGVLNAQLTNPLNQEARDKYVAEAQNNIKILSKADLSLPQNVSQAGKIFAPFYQDNDIVSDIYTTKGLNSEIQKGEAASTSTDKDIRASFNPESVKYLRGKLQDLSEAKRGNGSIQAIKTESWVPFKDVTEYLNTNAKGSGLKYEQTIDGTWQLTKTEGGQKAIIPFSRWADSQIGPQFNEQFRILGANANRDKINQLRNQGIDKESAQKQVGVENLQTFVQDKQTYLTGLKADHARAEQVLSAYDQGLTKRGGATPQEAAIRDQMKSDVDLYAGQIDRHTSDIASYLGQDGQLNLNNHESQAVIANPDFVSADKIKTGMLNNWATGYAMGHYSQDITANQGFANQMNYAISKGTLSLAVAAQQEKQKQDAILNQFKLQELANSTAETDLKYYQAGLTRGVGGISATDPLTGAITLTKSTKDFAHVDEQTLYERKVAFQKSQIGNALYSTDSRAPGVTKLLEFAGVLSPDESAVFNTYMNQSWSGEKPSTSPTVQRVIDKLHAQGILKADWHDSHEDMNKSINADLLAYATNNIANISRTLTPLQRQYYLESVDRLEKTTANYNSEQANIQKNVINELAKDVTHRYSKVTVIDENSGKPRIANTKDISNKFTDLNLEDLYGNEVSLTKTDIGKAYAGDQLKMHQPYFDASGNLMHPFDFKIGDKVYKTNNPYQAADLWNRYQNTQTKFGTSEEFIKTQKELYTHANPYAHAFKDETGKYANDIILPEQTPTTHKVINAIVNEGNYTDIFDNNGKSLKPHDDLMVALRNVGLSDEKKLDEIIGNVTMNPVGYGQTPTITLHLNTERVKDEAGKNAYADVAKLVKAGASEVTLEIDPTTTNPFLKKILQHAVQPQNDYFPELKEGKKVVSTPLRNQMGSGYIISPNSTDPRRISEYNVKVDNYQFDTKTGEFINKPFVQNYPNTYSGTDLLNEINKIQAQTAQANEIYFQTYSKNHPKISVQELEKRYQATVDAQNR